MKHVGLGTNAVKISGYFPAFSAVVMLKIEARPGWTRTRGCGSVRATKKSKTNHF